MHRPRFEEDKGRTGADDCRHRPHLLASRPPADAGEFLGFDPGLQPGVPGETGGDDPGAPSRDLPGGPQDARAPEFQPYEGSDSGKWIRVLEDGCRTMFFRGRGAGPAPVFKIPARRFLHVRPGAPRPSGRDAVSRRGQGCGDRWGLLLSCPGEGKRRGFRPLPFLPGPPDP